MLFVSFCVLSTCVSMCYQNLQKDNRGVTTLILIPVYSRWNEA